MQTPVNEAKLYKLAQEALASSKADQTEILFSVTQHALTRFANSQIHQNTQYADTSISVRAVIGKKIGVSSTNQLTSKAIKEAVERAVALARLQKEDQHFISLPGPLRPTPAPHGYRERTASHSARQKADAVREIIVVGRREKLKLSGAFETSTSQIAVANSLGVWVYHPGTSASLSITATGATGSGYASALDADVGAIDSHRVGRTAIDKAQRAQNPTDIEPGDYEVILEPTAVNDLLGYFSWLGPNARIYHEDVSFMKDKLGQKILSEHITIHEDALHPKIIPLPFDFEGVPKQRVTLFEKGVAKGIVYDSYHAHRYKAENTGHALPAPNTEGAIAGHLVFEPGKHTIQEMMASVKRGLLVTRFWYVNALHYKRLMLTGMTRDGTFLIENGTIVGPVKNLRFTQSVIDALASVEMVGDTVTAQGSWLGTNLVPTLKITPFHFSGSTEH